MSNYQDSDVTVSGTKSVVKYTPKNEMDFGTLVCWASNSVGAGAPPCVFHLLPIGPPEPPLACSASNVTYSTVKVCRYNLCCLVFDSSLRIVMESCRFSERIQKLDLCFAPGVDQVLYLKTNNGQWNRIFFHVVTTVHWKRSLQKV